MGLDPLVILAIGIVTVIGMIIVLRINAFIALITAAILVSLLSPGAVAEKISRVADAFGTSAGQIGIVIALAAVIGECMMRSGAADRVVRAFLRVLGEKRASFALLGSGYVLAIPVFFDTVFYLLVPLARSLFKRTGRNYLMYILAIAAGGAITHTLVPPTPGPLLMAANLNIDLGLMILVGALVALPAALAGIVYATFADRAMNIPMRPIGAAPEPEPLPDSELPPLLLAILPVVLPVLMISTNTVLTTMADAERAPRLEVSEIADWDSLRDKLVAGGGSEGPTPAGRVMRLLPEDVQAQLREGTPQTEEEQQEVVDALNRALVRNEAGQRLYEEEAFEPVITPRWKIERELEPLTGVKPSQEEAARLSRRLMLDDMLKQDRSRFRTVDLERFNRLLLEATFPDEIRRHTWETPLREAADVASLFGNANLALLVSMAIAMFVLYRQRRPTLSAMAETVETSLMSAGAIILITAAGGAFGAMLKVAGIGDAIQSTAQQGSSGAAGMMLLFVGFGVAAVLKIAQGSSTVAMITASSILAPMVLSPEALGFNPVYLATAIGAGSLVGSWMNDSGFWIFAKMGGLTEVEALKSWTPMLVVLGCVAMAVTVVLAITVPLLDAV